jgi:uncharacterized SAM-binding protein YcdF (DUF218 family)
LTLVLTLCAATVAALSFSPIANALANDVAASGRTTMRSGIVYDVAIVLEGAPLRAVVAADVVRSGRARYLLYSGLLHEAGMAELTALFAAHGVPPDRVLFEVRSRNTRENAVESSRIVRLRGWQSLLLVTSASHVERAIGCFHRVGLKPDVLAVRDEWTLPHSWLLQTAALKLSMNALHELIGRAVYRIVGYSTDSGSGFALDLG